ncbi:hypothetical protein C2G38_2246681 [Gigaspora rosea]|uniref:C2H2-type domain-containing protein n=1 Tax=Gigaspora rosea TaxID=44941 RepID=A0A397V389_9GLOM|nr:hypothetical protein C2G38_2246681 [Gigaspora rosea]
MHWQCEHCNREFSKSYALTQHVSQKHSHLQSSPNQEVSNEQVDDDIWDLPEDYPNYDSSEYGPSFATESYEIGLEDYEGASFDEAFQDLYHPRTVEWPNDAYHEFMEIINKYQLLNSAGKEFLDDTIVPYMMFKEVPVKTFQNVEYVFYYRPLIKTIKSLLMIDSINQSLVLQYEDKKEHLLSLILYSDATTLDHMEKSSGHPMFLSLGNIPNHQRNKPESKVLIGYLSILKAMDSKTKNSDKF